jgi:hypothetical protein
LRDEGCATVPRFADFRVLVDGRTLTLAEAGIVSIALIATGAPRRYADGSSIDGRSRFTRADGTTDTAADATFVSDGEGWRTTRGVATDASGRRTVTLDARAIDGTLVSRMVSVTSADGAETVATHDDDADGLVDRRQTTSETRTATGRTTVVRFHDRQGALVASTTTARLNGGRLEIVDLDQDGAGTADQSQRFEILANGASATTIAALNPDGSIRSTTRTETSADGLTTVTTQAPVGQTVHTRTHAVTTLATDGARSEAAVVGGRGAGSSAGILPFRPGGRGVIRGRPSRSGVVGGLWVVRGAPFGRGDGDLATRRI